jgi:hypothetical protein
MAGGRRHAGSYPYSQRQCFARIGRIMLGTIPGMQTEFPFSYKFEDWNKMLDATKGLELTAAESGEISTVDATGR